MSPGSRKCGIEGCYSRGHVHRNRHDVVDNECPRHDHPPRQTQVLPTDYVQTASVSIRVDDLTGVPQQIPLLDDV